MLGSDPLVSWYEAECIEKEALQEPLMPSLQTYIFFFNAFLKKYLKLEFHGHLDRVQVKGNATNMLTT